MGMDLFDFLRMFFASYKKKKVIATFFPPEIPSTTPGYHPEEQSKAYEEMHAEVASGERHYETLPVGGPPVHVEPMEEGPEKEAVKSAYEQYAESRKEDNLKLDTAAQEQANITHVDEEKSLLVTDEEKRASILAAYNDRNQATQTSSVPQTAYVSPVVAPVGGTLGTENME
jgi:hypothetical protein